MTSSRCLSTRTPSSTRHASSAAGRSNRSAASKPSARKRARGLGALRRVRRLSENAPRVDASSGLSRDFRDASAHTPARSKRSRPVNGSLARRSQRRALLRASSLITSKLATSNGRRSANIVDAAIEGSKAHTSTTTNPCAFAGCAGPATFAGTRPSRRTRPTASSSDHPPQSVIIERWERFTGGKAELDGLETD